MGSRRVDSSRFGMTFAAAMLLAAFTRPVAADGLIIVPEPMPRPDAPHAFSPLEVKRHHVNVTIDGQVATTHVDQVFVNPTGRRLEGTYLFPLPEGAEIDAFTMSIAGEQVEAELLDADKARAIYERIVRQAKDPALLEYVGRGAFKVRIFPIEPGSDKRVTLQYTQLLEAGGELVDYTYPLNTEKFSAAPIESLSVKCEVKTEHPLKTIYSPTHRVEVDRKGPNRAVIGFEAGGVRPTTDFRLLYSAPKSPEHGIAMNLLTHRGPDDDEGYYMLLASPGHDLTADEIAAKDVVFVIDTSGSMRGDKLAQATSALRFCVEQLNPRDRFQVVRFSTEAEPLFDKLADANADRRAEAEAFINDMKAIGGTAIHDAMARATEAIDARADAESRPAMVVFLTDGRPTLGVVDEDEIVKSVGKAGGARVFAFGVGTDVNTHLLDRISENTDAFTQYVYPDEDLELTISSFYRRISHPVLTDLTLDASGDVRLNRPSPRTLGSLFRGEQLVQFGRYTGHGHAAITLGGKVGTNTVKLVREVEFPEQSDRHDFVPRLWATRRVGYLLDQMRLHGETAELRDEVVRLARRFGIVTPYTSYLILEDERRREVPQLSRTIEGSARSAFSSDAELDEQVAAARESFRGMQVERSGDRAVSGARSHQKLRQAQQIGDSMDAAEEAAVAAPSLVYKADPRPGTAKDSAAAARARRAAQQAQQRFAGGRAFYRQGEQWIDATIQAHPDAERLELALGSDAYFDLLRKHPRANKWLSVGAQVQVRIDDTVYVVR